MNDISFVADMRDGEEEEVGVGRKRVGMVRKTGWGIDRWVGDFGDFASKYIYMRDPWISTVNGTWFCTPWFGWTRAIIPPALRVMYIQLIIPP